MAKKNKIVKMIQILKLNYDKDENRYKRYNFIMLVFFTFIMFIFYMYIHIILTLDDNLISYHIPFVFIFNLTHSL